MQKQKLGQDEQKPTASPHLGLTSVLLLPQGISYRGPVSLLLLHHPIPSFQTKY